MEENIKKEGGFEYVESGEGPVVVVLHGLFGALSNFKDVFEHFGSSYRVVIPIMPLYSLPVLKTNVKNLMEHIHDFIEFKGFDTVNLLGNSLGGHVALIYASEYPAKVDSMALTGSSGLYENTMGQSYPRKGNIDYVRERIEYTFYDPKTATDELVNECFAIVNDRVKTLKILSLAKSAIRHNMAEDLPNIQTPTCLIWGQQDSVTPPEVGKEFNKLLPNSEIFWMDKCGHAPMMEKPEEFNTIYESWLKKTLQ
ncbi:MAG: pimeloyl-ACP methyl ester carboxylesterase [Salibacteraceae bacterium]|jgi:pimeloyl-ACP methyl ester carboxylesterase